MNHTKSCSSCVPNVFGIFLFWTLEEYEKTENVQEKISFEELCEKIEGFTYIEELVVIQ
jgi:hypothetical protein